MPTRRHKHWSHEELQYLTANYPYRATGTVCSTLGRSRSAVLSKAAALKLKKINRSAPTKTEPNPGSTLRALLQPLPVVRTYVAVRGNEVAEFATKEEVNAAFVAGEITDDWEVYRRVAKQHKTVTVPEILV